MVIIIGRKRIDLHHSDDCEEKKNYTRENNVNDSLEGLLILRIQIAEEITKDRWTRKSERERE